MAIHVYMYVLRLTHPLLVLPDFMYGHLVHIPNLEIYRNHHHQHDMDVCGCCVGVYVCIHVCMHAFMYVCIYVCADTEVLDNKKLVSSCVCVCVCVCVRV
jgi:hypothetical protein